MIARSKAFASITAAFIIFISASGAYADNQWSSYHWEKKGGELTLSIGDNHNGEGHAPWSELLGGDLSGDVAAYWDGGGFGGSYLTINVVTGGEGDIESYNDHYGDTGWLGLASIWIKRGKNKHIVRGESKVNDYYIDLAGYDRFSSRDNWIHVLCQEIGHTFGLDHNREGATCMNDQTPDLIYPTPNSHDTDMLNIMYAEDHGDGGGSKDKKCHPIRGCGQSRVHAFWAEHYEDEQELLEASDAVVEATVLSSSFSHMVGGPDRAVPITRVILKVAETIKGKASRVIVLQQTRGPGLEIEDDPGYVTGDAYTLYLRQVGVNSYRVVNPDGRIRH